MNSLIVALNIIKRTLPGIKGWLIFIITPAVVISIVIGLLGHQKSDTTNIYYTNLDQGFLGQHIVTQMESHSGYHLTPIENRELLQEEVISRKTQAAFLIPETFTETMLSEQNSQVEMFQLNVNEASFTLQIHLDQKIQQLIQAIQIVNSQETDSSQVLDHLELLLLQVEKQEIKAEITDYELYTSPVLYLVTGFLLMFMMYLIGSFVSTVLEDRKQMTMTRIFTAPVRSYEIALGNLMGSLFLGCIQVLSILLISRYILGFNYGISFFAHFLILFFFLLAILGIATAVAGLVRSSANVGVINNLIVTPTCMIGGCFWPVEIMPEFLQKAANFVPQKWAIDAVVKIASGQSILDVWMNIVILGLFALILLSFGSSILKPNESQVN